MGNLTLNRGMATILIFGAAVRPDGTPGATLRHRVETALAAAQGDPEALFIPSGAVGRHGGSEASVMAGILLKSGVHNNRILLEETGYDTLSSVRAFHRLLREQKAPGRVMVATSLYHLPRCLTLLCIFGISAHRCAPVLEPAPASLWKRWYWRLREVPALPYDAGLALWARITGKL
jgi:vancomycin permeability regulator SanA